MLYLPFKIQRFYDMQTVFLFLKNGSVPKQTKLKSYILKESKDIF